MTGQDFENHLIFNKLDQLKTRIDEEELRNALSIEDIIFFETALAYIHDRLRLTIPAIVQDSELATIAQELENSLSNLNAYRGNKNIGHISTAKNHLYTTISRIRNLPLPFSNNDFDFSSAISKFEIAVRNKYNELENQNTELKESLTDLQVELKNNKSEIQKLNQSLKKKEGEINTLNSQFQVEFNNTRSKFTQENTEYAKKINQEFESLKNKSKIEIDDLKSGITNSTQNIINELNDKLFEAKKIVGVIADDSVTGNYKLVANANKSTADIFRWIAIALMLILSGLLIYTIWDINTEEFNWLKSLVRILAAVILSYPATYAARESSRHRKLEIQNRKAELELTAINPFIELLSETKKQEIKEKLVEKYFGNNFQEYTHSDNQKDDDISISVLDKLLKTILPYIKK